MNETIVLDVQIAEQYEADVSIDTEVEAEADGSIIINKIVAEEFEGAYEYTPSGETQTIPIAQKKAVRNITINPIPQNYGLVTWNGAFLHIS